MGQNDEDYPPEQKRWGYASTYKGTYGGNDSYDPSSKRKFDDIHG